MFIIYIKKYFLFLQGFAQKVTFAFLLIISCRLTFPSSTYACDHLVQSVQLAKSRETFLNITTLKTIQCSAKTKLWREVSDTTDIQNYEPAENQDLELKTQILYTSIKYIAYKLLQYSHKYYKSQQATELLYRSVDRIVDNQRYYDPEHVPMIKSALSTFAKNSPQAVPLLTDTFFENLNLFYLSPLKWITFINEKISSKHYLKRITNEFHSPEKVDAAYKYYSSIDVEYIQTELTESCENFLTYIERKQEIKLTPDNNLSELKHNFQINDFEPFMFNLLLKKLLVNFWASAMFYLYK
uniref:Uncharacterized protein n=1 Tax=Udotea sp. TZ0819 TaxID=2364085 RepID=A0A386B214_9CHLO|nr:hypothetical protein [Udotea sp. TZ0819]